MGIETKKSHVRCRIDEDKDVKISLKILI